VFDAFFTARAKSDDPLSHPQYGATQNGLPTIRTGVHISIRIIIIIITSGEEMLCFYFCLCLSSKLKGYKQILGIVGKKLTKCCHFLPA